MSTFNGFIEEIPGISVDQFYVKNLPSSVFFLSHCHSDHMYGLLENSTIISSKEDGDFYASPISVRILKEMYPFLTGKLKPLDMYRSTLISVPPTKKNNYVQSKLQSVPLEEQQKPCTEEKIISVTPIPAGHCPGSVMFLFEIDDKKILYTGDFRLNADELEKFPQFYDMSGELIKIDKMYLDTTFFNTDYIRFPSREDCVEDICNRIKEWISLGKDYNINIVNSANYGSEYLFNEIYKRIGMPIHTRAKLYDSYKYFPEMDKIVTLNGDVTQIHSSCVEHRRICTNKNVREIIPSAFIWRKSYFEEQEQNKDLIGISNQFRFCYSCHSSYEETLEFLNFLKPKQIYPNVLPKLSAEKKELFELIDRTIKNYTEKEDGEEIPEKNVSEKYVLENNFSPKIDHTSEEKVSVDLFSIEEFEANEMTKSLRKFKTESPKKAGRERVDDDLLSSPPRTYKRAREKVTP